MSVTIPISCINSNCTKKRFNHISQSNTGAVKPSYTYIVIRWCGSCRQVRFVCFGPERERERDHGGVLACAMIGITDLLSSSSASSLEMMDSCACWNLDSTVKVTSLFGGGLRRTSSPIFHSYGVRGSHLIERDGVGNFHCLHTYLLLVLHTNQLKCLKHNISYFMLRWRSLILQQAGWRYNKNRVKPV